MFAVCVASQLGYQPADREQTGHWVVERLDEVKVIVRLDLLVFESARHSSHFHISPQIRFRFTIDWDFTLDEDEVAVQLFIFLNRFRSAWHRTWHINPQTRTD